ncbi:MAG: response regulator transcription factor [Myxococcales bacterium]|nr:response regulator transcription factor [Myxococcales bacterium]
MPSPRLRILIVEDDASIREGLDLNLGLEGYETVCAPDGDRAIEAFQRQRPDLVLLDVMLPGRNGFEVLRDLRARRKDVPVILLTARIDEADKVLGLELGADDYVTKPFGLGELRARIRAALRRASIQADGNVGAFGDVEIDRSSHRVRRLGSEVPMTAREFSLLVHFLDHPERVLSREALLRRVWGLEHATLRTVDNFVMRLRSKLEPDPDTPRYFVTVRGVGYRFTPSASPE